MTRSPHGKVAGMNPEKPMVSASKCPSGKIGYLTIIGAKLALAQTRKKRVPGEGEWTEYWCRACGNFHLTSNRQG